jgi:hypothetical protein
MPMRACIIKFVKLLHIAVFTAAAAATGIIAVIVTTAAAFLRHHLKISVFD